MAIDIEQANQDCSGLDPAEIIRYAVERADGLCVVSSNFRPGEAAILHLCSSAQRDMPVLWVDHGYNTPDTYRFVERLRERLQLDIRSELPTRSAAHRDAVEGGFPGLDEPERHAAFTDEVKIAPFKRGLAALKPAVWFTAVRRDQTAFRSGMQVFAREDTGLVDCDLVKVSPLLDWTEAEVEHYLQQHDLPDERVYFDPTKVEGGRECGLHPGLKKGS